MSTSYKFQPWLAFDPGSAEGKMKWQGCEPKDWEETDVDIKVTDCGICGSDLHMAGVQPFLYPCCVGHEIFGSTVEMGIKVKDQVDIGAQSSSYLKPDCEECASDMKNHCTNMVGTYDGRYGDGSESYSGYSDYRRAPSHFVLKISDSIPSEEAAPMLCGGITVSAPLKKNGCGMGKKVGIVGMGGLGYFSILYAKAFGPDSVSAISFSSTKKKRTR